MEVFIGIDVSLDSCAICAVDERGRVVRESKLASDPEALRDWFHPFADNIAAVGLEAGPLSQWLHKGLTDVGIPVTLMETRQVKAALKAAPIKTDRRDAAGIAQLLRLGWFRPVHCKSVSAQEMRVLLGARRSVNQAVIDLELSLRGMLRNFGLRLGKTGKVGFETLVRDLISGNRLLELSLEPMLRARAALRTELARLERMAREIAREDKACRLMMTMPGIGAIVALTVRSAIDDPARFRSSKDVGPWVGLTPGRYQSGETDVIGSITKAGDVGMRTALYQAASVIMYRSKKPSWIKTWGMQLARRRGMKRAVTAMARRVGVVLHRMWVDGTEFCAVPREANQRGRIA